jgi:hypothetical protein
MIDLIANSQIKAKVQDERDRMRQAAIAIDFYNGKQKAYMESVIAEIYPKTWQDVKNYISCSGLTKAIIDQISVLFVSPPEIDIDFHLPSEAGQPKPKLTASQEAIRERLKAMLVASDFWKKLIAIDRMANLTGKVGICQHWHEADKRVVVDIITPDKCFVIQDAEDPTRASVVYYVIGRDTDPRLASPVNIYAKWTRDTYSEVKLNENLQEIETVKGSEIPNIYGKIPIEWISPLIEVDSFWVDHGYPIVDGNINVNLRESNLDMGLDYQMFSTMVTKGLNKPETTILGVTRRLDLPASDMGNAINSDAYYITPDAKLTEVNDIIQTKKTGYGKENGLSANAFNQDMANITSGYQLMLTERQLGIDNQLRKEIYRNSIIAAVKNMITCYNAKSQEIIPPDSDITLYYVDKRFVSNPLEEVTLLVTKLNVGLISLPDALRELDPSLSQEDAMAEAKRIQSEKQQLSGGIRPITEQDLLGT